MFRTRFKVRLESTSHIDGLFFLKMVGGITRSSGSNTQMPNDLTRCPHSITSGVAVEAAELVPSGFALLGLCSNGDTGEDAGGEESPGIGFSPASGFMSSGVRLAHFSTSVIGLESSKGALDAGPCHIKLWIGYRLRLVVFPIQEI